MTSLAEKIAKLTTNSDIFDPEDEICETAPRILPFPNSEANVIEATSELRRKNAPLLEDVDPTYSGRKVSRKSLGKVFSSAKEYKKEESIELFDNEYTSDDDETEESDDELNDDGIEDFRRLLSQSKDSNEEEEEGDESSNEDIISENEEKDSMVKTFSSIDVSSEVEKGLAIKNQKEIWNRLLEARIKTQKLLIIANKFPQSTSWKSLEETDEIAENIVKSAESLKTLKEKLLELNTMLINKNIELKQFNDRDDQEENEKIELRQKRKNNEISESLEKRFKSLIPYRNSVIQKFDEKTKLSTGKMTQKSFNAFDNSALKQIDKILEDRTRLIKRTQLKRSLYRVLGKPDSPSDNTEHQVVEASSSSKQDLLLKDYDPEIFDDDDFYRQILKDVIESKSFGIDPTFIQKQMEIQKIRNKMKRKIDTKASKGRKLRYDVHPKMVNFSAKLQVSLIPEESRINILRSLFV